MISATLRTCLLAWSATLVTLHLLLEAAMCMRLATGHGTGWLPQLVAKRRGQLLRIALRLVGSRRMRRTSRLQGHLCSFHFSLVMAGHETPERASDESRRHCILR